MRVVLRRKCFGFFGNVSGFSNFAKATQANRAAQTAKTLGHSTKAAELGNIASKNKVIGAAKMGGLAAAGGIGLYGAAKAGTYYDALTGNMGEKSYSEVSVNRWLSSGDYRED